MDSLTVEDVVKLASVSKNFRSLLAGTAKTAAEGPTDFDETVPVNEEPEKKEEKKPPEKKEEKPAAEPIVPPQAEVPPPAPAASATPEAAGANAARAFVGEDTMSAAASGDPNAQDMVARIAGQVAAGVAESAARKMAPAEGMPPEAMSPEKGAVPPVPPAEGAPAGATAVPAAPQSPEEAVANDIAPPPNGGVPPAVGNQIPGKGPDTSLAPVANASPVPAGGGGQPVDLATVQKLIQLAKSGQI